jgi:hypothetical protein
MPSEETKLYLRLPGVARRRQSVRWAAGPERSPVGYPLGGRGDPEQAGPTPPGIPSRIRAANC